jgi:tetratricopeptide (TPR) repeat protein
MQSCKFLGYNIVLMMGLMALLNNAWAAPLVIDAQKQLAYARSLYEEGQYRQAADEFERFAFFFPDDPQQPLAVFSAGRSFLQARESMLAMQRFQQLMTENANMSELEVEARFMMVECYLMLKSPDQAISLLDHLADRSTDTVIKDRAYLRMTWILIDQLNWQGAHRSLSHISPNGRERRDITILDRELTRSDTIAHKSPALAGTLSIVPGGGQLYCGRYQDALAALVVNGGLFWASYESFDNDLNALGGMLAVVGIGFYTANIYGAISSAHKYNLRQQKGFAERLKQSVRINISPGAMSSTQGKKDLIAMTFSLNF